MMDRRELILLQLFSVLKSIPGIATCVRGRAQLPDEMLPAIYLLDADETARENAFNRGRPIGGPNLISLSPEIYISVQSQQPENETVSQLLSGFRVAILKAIFVDAILKSLIGSNGEIQYQGCITDLARGRDMHGTMGLIVAFSYVFKPSEL